MKEINFKHWGTFKTKGYLRVSDPCHLDDNPVKVKLSPGEYEVLACSASKVEDEYTETGVLGIVLKKTNAKLDFKKLKAVKGKFPETTHKISLVEESYFKTLSEETSEAISWSPLVKPKSRLLQGDEIKAYNWWETIAIKDQFICAATMQYNGKFYVFQGPGVLMLTAYPLTEDFSEFKFHGSKAAYFKATADNVRKIFLETYLLQCEIQKRMKVAKEKVKEKVLGGKVLSAISHRILDDKINELYQKVVK